jgi:glycolate dehydrogenase FAD-linked subunit
VAATASTSLERDLKALLGDGAVLPGDTRAYLTDATESRNLRGKADAVALPKDANAVAQTVAWCYEHDVPIIPRGGGTGLAGGAVPLDGGVVPSLENLKKIGHLDPGLWRAAVEAGVVTADLRRRARENGLFFPPDPGSAEQSQLGGNIATNAGGPHAFKYGVTGAWITGLEFVLAPGELVRVGSPVRKDVAGYDLKSLMIGSEGTLGVVTAAWVKMIPAPEAALPLAALYPDTETGCDAIESVYALWRWRDGASIAVTAQRGGKVSEDIVVPVDRLQQAIGATIEIGRRHDLPACSWGHAGNGNLHSTFMIDLEDPAELTRAEQAAEDLFALAVELGGSVSGEHGIGLVKNGQIAAQWEPAAVAVHEAIKRTFDPKGVLNPGKKLARA